MEVGEREEAGRNVRCVEGLGGAEMDNWVNLAHTAGRGVV
jgi:hypothetical protein